MSVHRTLRAANSARQREWDTDGQIDLAYRGNELAGECGEACNVIKKLEREKRGIRGSRATLERLAEELADVVICADLIAMNAGIDLDAAVEAKFNATSEKVGLRTVYRRDGATPADVIALGRELLERVTFDDRGQIVAGAQVGGNGGLLSQQTIEAAEQLRRALGDYDRALKEKRND